MEADKILSVATISIHQSDVEEFRRYNTAKDIDLSKVSDKEIAEEIADDIEDIMPNRLSYQLQDFINNEEVLERLKAIKPRKEVGVL